MELQHITLVRYYMQHTVIFFYICELIDNNHIDIQDKRINTYKWVSSNELEKAELDKKLEEGEEDIRNNKVHNARKVFKELREEYGY